MGGDVVLLAISQRVRDRCGKLAVQVQLWARQLREGVVHAQEAVVLLQCQNRLPRLWRFEHSPNREHGLRCRSTAWFSGSTRRPGLLPLSGAQVSIAVIRWCNKSDAIFSFGCVGTSHF